MATRAGKDDEVEEVDPSKNKAVTGRPNDLEIVEYEHPLPNSTLGSRAKDTKKRVTAEDKVAKDVETK